MVTIITKVINFFMGSPFLKVIWVIGHTRQETLLLNSKIPTTGQLFHRRYNEIKKIRQFPPWLPFFAEPRE